MTKAPTPAEMSKGQSDNTNNATKKFDYTVVADRFRTVSWSNYGHPTGVVNRFTGPTFPLPLLTIFTYCYIIEYTRSQIGLLSVRLCIFSLTQSTTQTIIMSLDNISVDVKAYMKSYIPLETAAIFFLTNLFLKQGISLEYVMVDFICMG